MQAARDQAERRDEIDRVVAVGLARAHELLLSTSIGPAALEEYMAAEIGRMAIWRDLALAELTGAARDGR